MSAADVPPELRDLYAYLRRRKATEVRRRAEGLPVLIDVERDGRRLARLEAPSPEAALDVIARAPAALDAEALGVAFDAWMSTSPTNPVKGRDWNHGDMDEIANLDAGLERGLLREALNVNRITRAERRWTGVTLQYTHDRDRARLTWGGVIKGEYRDDPAGPIGRFPRVALEAFARPAFADEVARFAPDLGGPDEVAAQFKRHRRRLDVTAVRMLARWARVIEGPDGPGLGE